VSTEATDTPLEACPALETARGLLLALAPAAIFMAPGGDLLTEPRDWLTIALALLTSVSLAVAAFGLRRPPFRGARMLASVAIVVWVGWWLSEHMHAPGRGFLVLVGAASAMVRVWPNERLRQHDLDRGYLNASTRSVLAAALVALVIGLDAWQHAEARGPVRSIALAGTALVPSLLLLRHPVRARSERILRPLALLVPAAIVLVHFLSQPLAAGRLAVIAPLLVLSTLRAHDRANPDDEGVDLPDLLLSHPPRALVGSFLGICTAGAFLLALPLAAESGRSVGVVDAAFTAVSATCVTGLTVRDTPVEFSSLGEFFVLVLIQVGGLGIMTFSSAALTMLGRRMSLAHEATAADAVGAASRADLAKAVRRVIQVSVISEAIGAVLLLPLFLWHGDHLLQALWRAIFTSISAFCNAGFALQSDNLVPYARDPFVLLVVGAIIVLGGLGPAVVVALPDWARGRRTSLRVRMVVMATVTLVVGPAVLIAVLEWSNTLAGLGPVDRIVNALFQSITLRTAGFNSIDIASIHPVTWTVMIVTMFIGGSPGSTAGGVKTTSFAVLLLAVAATIRGRTSAEFGGRTVPQETVYRAAAITTVGTLTVVAFLMGIQLTQGMDSSVGLFEVVSALGTVGLSQGGTAQLDSVGKIIIMGAMFAGRVGPLTLFLFLAERARSAHHRLPEEPVPVG